MATKGDKRPKYDDDFHPEDFIRLSKKGYTLSEICSEWCISRDTLWRWTRDKENKSAMTEAFAEGKMHREAWFVKAGKAAMMGKVKNASGTHFVWLTKNTLGWNDDPDPYDQADVIEDVEF